LSSFYHFEKTEWLLRSYPLALSVFESFESVLVAWWVVEVEDNIYDAIKWVGVPLAYMFHSLTQYVIFKNEVLTTQG
jgi:hypothetical protein